jgi:hypothetical protein
MTMPPEGDRSQDEIRQIEQDLENLERRYATLEDAVRWLKLGFRVIAAALIALAIVSLIIGRYDLVAVATGFLLLIALGVGLGPRSLGPGLPWARRQTRWIDIIGWRPPGVLGVGVKRSEAMAIEDMIADRQSRLARLREKR